MLAYRSDKYRVGVLEDVPIRIGEFYIHVDFFIMEIEESTQIPILLGRPFLDTARAFIDFKRGKLTFEVRKKRIEFILSKLMKNPSIRDPCCLVDVIDACVQEAYHDPF